jgi:hypothetical protein
MIETKIAAIPAQMPGEKRAWPQHEILEEWVATVHGVEGMMMELPSMLDHLLHRVESRRLRIGTGTEAGEGKAGDSEL